MSKILYYLKSPFLLAALVCAIFFYTGLVPVRQKNLYASPVPIESVIWISGAVSSNPLKSSSGKTYTAKIRLREVKSSGENMMIKSRASGDVTVRLPSSIVESVYPGKLYSISKGSVLVEEGEILSCGGRWSESQGAFVVDSIVHEGHGGGFWGELMHFRAMCRLVFKRLMFSWGLAGGLVLSLLSGSREYLEDGIGDSFRLAGLSHILALSGMHLSFFSSIVGGVGRRFGKRVVPLFQLLGILFFVWFAGLSPSLFRALLCSLITLTAKFVFCRKVDTLEVLACTFILHSVIIPNDMFSVAFMLSYGALAGILVFSDLINRLVSPVVPPQISGSLSASTGAQIATCPISMGVFGSFAPIGILSTVIVSPLISFFITLSLLFIIFSFALPFLSPFFGDIMNVMYGLVAGIVRFFARVPPVQISDL